MTKGNLIVIVGVFVLLIAVSGLFFAIYAFHNSKIIKEKDKQISNLQDKLQVSKNELNDLKNNIAQSEEESKTKIEKLLESLKILEQDINKLKNKNKIDTEELIKKQKELLPKINFDNLSKIENINKIPVNKKYIKEFSLNYNNGICSVSVVFEEIFKYPTFIIVLYGEFGTPVARISSTVDIAVKPGEVRLIEVPIEKLFFKKIPAVNPIYYDIEFLAKKTPVTKKVEPEQVQEKEELPERKEIISLISAIQNINTVSLKLCLQYDQEGLLPSTFKREYQKNKQDIDTKFNKLKQIIDKDHPAKFEKLFNELNDFYKSSVFGHDIIKKANNLELSDPIKAIAPLNMANTKFKIIQKELPAISNN